MYNPPFRNGCMQSFMLCKVLALCSNDFDYFISIKFCVADRLDLFNNFNAAFSVYADACAGRNDVFKTWIARISDRCCMFTSGALWGVGNVVCWSK